MYMARNVVNLPVWVVFICKVVYQKSQKSVCVCKSYCERNQWHLFYVDVVYSTMKTKDPEALGRQLNLARSKPDTVNQPVRTARTFVHHYNSTQYCSTETVYSIFPFLQTKITSQMWPSGGWAFCFWSVKNFYFYSQTFSFHILHLVRHIKLCY